ncbi:MAG: hypothetical protein KC731_27490 [Myxococcales bacterium]|nr:hypothetical protein [Myxococcales bacterium]
MTDDGAKFDHHAPSMCPVVNTLVEQDWVKPQRDHRVAIEQIREGLSHLAITTPLKSLLVIGPLFANHRGDLLRNLVTQTFSLPHLRGGFFAHPASTDTLEKSRFDAEKFAVFEKAAIAARTPGVIGVDALAFVIVFNQLTLISQGKPTSASGFLLSLIEFASLLDTFGVADDEGRLHIRIEDLRGLYASGSLPGGPSWRPVRTKGLRTLGATMGKIGSRALGVVQNYEDALDSLEIKDVDLGG